MSLTIVIILCVAITAILIIFPLIVSYKAEKTKKQNEWDKIAEYGNKINDKTRKKQVTLSH
jgi:H+/gluconate symporter-like permease